MSARDRFNAVIESTPPPGEGPNPYIGTMLDNRYRVLSLMAEGAQGRVYLARHALIKREVAIKILSPAADAGLVDRFLSEGRAAGMLGHPNEWRRSIWASRTTVRPTSSSSFSEVRL